MPDDLEPRRPTADRGTGLGASTNFLTRLFAIVMWPVVAIPRAGRALGKLIGRVFGGEHRFLRRVAAAASAFGMLIGRVWAAATNALGRVLGPIGSVVATVWRAFADVARTIWEATAHVATVAGAAIARVTAAIARSLASTARPIAHAIAVASRTVARVVTAAARACAHVLVNFGHAIAAAFRRAATVLGPPLARGLRAAGRGLGFVLLIPVSLIAGVIYAAVWPFRIIGRALVRPLRAALHALTALVTPPARAAARALTAAAQAVAESSRAMGRRIAFTGRRVAHSVGVAYLRARLMNASTRTPAADSYFAPDQAPRALVPFEAAVFQNEWLPRGGREVHAIITVTAHTPPDSGDDSAPETAEVILVDCSGSMGHPWQKLRAARTATAAAIDTLRDGTWFAIVRGSHAAETVYPLGGGLVRATNETRIDALSALGLLWPEGGTAMGQWLTLARELLDTRPHAIPHAILLTDGKNESETPAQLETALKGVAGRFQCDCRGVGTDWDVAELRTISSQMLGTVDIVPDPDDLAADFEAMTTAAMAKRVGDTRLRVWTPQGAVVHFLQQVAPEVQDVTTQRRPVGRQTGEYAIGSWGDETRDYHLCVRVPDKAIGAEMLAARVSVVVGDHVVTSSLVRAIWTDDEEAVTRVSPQVAHFSGQTELVALIQEGVLARRIGDDDRATEKLGRAAQVAHASGNDDTLKLLANVVDIIDAPTGQVRLKVDVELADEMALDTRSAKTVRVGS